MLKLVFFLCIIISSGCLKTILGDDYCLSSGVCINGFCNDNGDCICNSCWRGERCDEFEDKYSPIFHETLQLIKIKSTTTGDLFTISAFDEDLALTCKYDAYCPCAVVYYFIMAGNDHQMFELDSEKGIVSLSNWAQLYSETNHRLVFGISNNNLSAMTTSELMVDLEIEGNETGIDFAKLRRKRDSETGKPYIVFQRSPPNAVPEIQYGSGANFLLEIILPSKIVNLKLDISTRVAGTDKSTLRLCDVEIRKGPGVKSPAQTDIKSKFGSWYSGINLDFGSIPENQTSPILIEFRVLLIKTKLAVDNSLHEVEVKAEIDNEERVFKQQINAKIPSDYNKNFYGAFFSLTGPDIGERGTTIVYQLTVVSKFPSEDMQFVIFAWDDQYQELSVEYFTLLSKGKNFLCLNEDAIRLIVTNEDKRFLAKLDMGVVNNCGVEANDKANTLLFQFTVKISDKIENDISSFTNVTFGAKIGGKIIWTGNTSLTILPRKAEKSYVNVTLSSHENLIYGDGDEAQLKLTMKCNSQLNFILLRVFLPQFLNYRTHSENVSGVLKSDTPYLQFEIKNPIKGISQIIVVLSVDLKSRRQQNSPESTIFLPVQVVCEFKSELYFCAHVNPAPIKLKPIGLSCPEIKPFTLDSCQLSSSTSINEQLSPNGNSYWSPAFRLGFKNNFYQVNFGNLSLVTQLKLLSGSATTQSIKKFDLMTSIDGRSWTVFGKELSGDLLNLSVLTRFLRILILEPTISVKDDQEIGAKFQFAGCVITHDFSLSTTCNYVPQTRISTDVTKYRHYTIDESRNIFYFCDVVQEMLQLSCFCSLDRGKTWKGLPTFIGYLKGYNPRLKTVVATDTRGSSLIKSENCVWWMPASTEDAESLTRSVCVPGEKADTLSNLASFDKWKVDFDGIRYDGELKVDWQEVCR